MTCTPSPRPPAACATLAGGGTGGTGTGGTGDGTGLESTGNDTPGPALVLTLGLLAAMALALRRRHG